MLVRDLYATDLDKGFVETLSALRPVTLSLSDLIRVFQSRFKAGVLTYVAILKEASGEVVVGTASMFVEPKFFHDGRFVGHVEDVAVLPSLQRKGIGRDLMFHLETEAKKRNCYKLILNRDDTTQAFYESLNYYQAATQMRKDL